MDDNDLEISPVAAFSDNYFWLIRQGELAVVVDPGAARPVLDALAGMADLEAILITHHHADHTGGIRELRRRYPQAKVYGPAKENIAGVTDSLRQGDSFIIDGLNVRFDVLDVPGHTLGHIAYYVREHRPPLLFCGDTLFSAGCGRLFEGSPGVMHDSLTKLTALPSSTLVFSAHEYTLKNIAFAMQIEPSNPMLLERVRRVSALRSKGRPTLPSSMEIELATNPFLRTGVPGVITAAESYAGRTLSGPVEVFAALRRWKDEF